MSFSDFLEVLLRQLQFVKLPVLIINYSRKNIAIISPSDSYDNFITPIFINFLLNLAKSLFLPFFCTYFLPLCFVPQVTIWLVTHPHVCKYGNMFWYSKGFSLQDVFQQALQLVVHSFAFLALLQGRWNLRGHGVCFGQFI